MKQDSSITKLALEVGNAKIQFESNEQVVGHMEESKDWISLSVTGEW